MTDHEKGRPAATGAARTHDTEETTVANMDERINEMRALRTAEDPCQRTTPHRAHRNWHSEEVGVCPGVQPAKEEK